MKSKNVCRLILQSQPLQIHKPYATTSLCNARNFCAVTGTLINRQNNTYSRKSSNRNQFLHKPSLSGCDRKWITSATTSIDIPKVLVNDMDNQELLIEFNDAEAVRYPSFWLRDHCLCTECSHPQTHQRQINTFDIGLSIKASETNATSSGLEVTWDDNTKHRSTYPWHWLQQHTPFPSRQTASRFARKRKWVQIPPSSRPFPSTSYNFIMSADEGVKAWINQIHTYGLSFVTDTPTTPEATEALLKRICFIRETHYGAFWEFTSQANPIDTAYTNLGLFSHTDNTYWTDAAGLQMFHCLEHTSSASPDTSMSGEGGESIFVDGFAAAAYLYRIDRKAYNALSSIPVICAAEGAPEGPFFNNAVNPGKPVFNHYGSPTGTTLAPASSFIPSNLCQISWNNSDRSPLTTFPNHSVMKTWYAAAKLWHQILESKDFEIEVKLQPGEPVIFDNWRMLHGRRAFKGKRSMCGGYINMDDFRAKGRVLGLEM